MIQSFRIEFKFHWQKTANTMDSDDPDLEPLNPIFVRYFEQENQERLQHWCPIFAQTHQTLNQSVCSRKRGDQEAEFQKRIQKNTQKSQTGSCPEFQCQVAQNSSVRSQVLPVASWVNYKAKLTWALTGPQDQYLAHVGCVKVNEAQDFI